MESEEEARLRQAAMIKKAEARRAAEEARIVCDKAVREAEANFMRAKAEAEAVAVSEAVERALRLNLGKVCASAGCRKLNPDVARFCMHCGAPLRA